MLRPNWTKNATINSRLGFWPLLTATLFQFLLQESSTLHKEEAMIDDPLIIAGKSFRSRLIVGTGKYRTLGEMRDAIDASGAEMVTVAIRRLPLDPDGRGKPGAPNLMDYLDWGRYTIVPNTAGSRTVEEALFTAHLARELTGSDWVKLEVIPDPKYLLPDPVATLEAAQ